MSIAYLDTSCLVAIAFGEPRSRKVASRLRDFKRLVSSNLLEAEFRSALIREGAPEGGELLQGISWVHPEKALTAQFETILHLGYLRGADLWHLACALFLRERLSEIAFLTLDGRQGERAAALSLVGL